MNASSAPSGSYHHGDLAQALLAAAESRLERAGPESLSLRELARDAGVSAAAPYRHFKDKQSVLIAVAARGFRRLGQAMAEEGQTALDPAALLHARGRAYVRFAREHPNLFRLLFSFMPPDEVQAAELRQAGQAAFEMLRQPIATLQPGAPAEDRALMLWSLVHGLSFLMIDGGAQRLVQAGDEEAAVDRVLAMVWGGLGP